MNLQKQIYDYCGENKEVVLGDIMTAFLAYTYSGNNTQSIRNAIGSLCKKGLLVVNNGYYTAKEEVIYG